MRTKSIINHLHCLENAIIIYSNSNEDYVAISTIDKVGNIKAEWSSVQKYRKEHKKERIIVGFKTFFIFLPLVLVLTTLFCILLFRVVFTDAFDVYSFRIFIQFFLGCNLVIILTTLLYRPKAYLKLYSASGMLLNAYQELGRTPSLDELRKYSTSSIFNGTNSLVLKGIITILVLFCTYIPNLFVAIILSVIVLKIVKPRLEILIYRYGLMDFSQIFSRATPTDTELEVAISALKVWIENEGYK